MIDYRQIFIIIRLLIVIVFLIIIAMVDIREYRIPNKLLLIAIGIRIMIFALELIFYRIDIKEIGNKSIIIAGILISGVIINILTHNGIGLGDIKLICMISLYVEVNKIIYVIFYSILIMGVITCILLLIRKKGRKDIIPFAPAILLGVIATCVSYV